MERHLKVDITAVALEGDTSKRQSVAESVGEVHKRGL